MGQTQTASPSPRPNSLLCKDKNLFVCGLGWMDLMDRGGGESLHSPVVTGESITHEDATWERVNESGKAMMTGNECVSDRRRECPSRARVVVCAAVT